MAQAQTTTPAVDAIRVRLAQVALAGTALLVAIYLAGWITAVVAINWPKDGIAVREARAHAYLLQHPAAPLGR